MRQLYDEYDELTALGREFEDVKHSSCLPNDDDLTVLETLHMINAEGDKEMFEMNTAWVRRFRSLLAKGLGGDPPRRRPGSLTVQPHVPRSHAAGRLAQHSYLSARRSPRLPSSAQDE